MSAHDHHSAYDHAAHAGHDEHAHHGHGHHMEDDSLASNVTTIVSNLTTTLINTTVAAITQATTPSSVLEHAHHGHHDHGQHDHSSHVAPVDHSAHAAHHEHEMKMWFHGGCEEVILFDFWRINSYFGLFVSCLVIFIFGALYEGLKWFRVYTQTNPNPAQSKDLAVTLRFSNVEEKLEQALIKTPETAHSTDCMQDVVYAPTTVQASNGTLQTKNFRSFITNVIRHNEKTVARHRVVQAGLYCVQLTLAYWLMLIAMTYNIWLTAAVIFGAGFGHWLFAALKCVTPNTSHHEAVSGDACH